MAEAAGAKGLNYDGVEEEVVVPFPNCPFELLPQHLICPEAMIAQAYPLPTLKFVAPVSPAI
jgi:hypothetical protein